MVTVIVEKKPVIVIVEFKVNELLAVFCYLLVYWLSYQLPFKTFMFDISDEFPIRCLSLGRSAHKMSILDGIIAVLVFVLILVLKFAPTSVPLSEGGRLMPPEHERLPS
jgi:hypothetical protein